ncbi:hypothetical protein ACTFIV_003982 [Dictyostelium citrinum]
MTQGWILHFCNNVDYVLGKRTKENTNGSMGKNQTQHLKTNKNHEQEDNEHNIQITPKIQVIRRVELDMEILETMCLIFPFDVLVLLTANDPRAIEIVRTIENSTIDIVGRSMYLGQLTNREDHNIKKEYSKHCPKNYHI